MKVLVTGGAGFIGSHLVDALVGGGHAAVILDNLDPQVHPGGKAPAWLNREAEFVHGDVRDRAKVQKALRGCSAVVHLAGAVGVGQSQYQIHRYSDVNVGGTALLLDEIVNARLELAKVVVAGSMSSYGEGLYSCAACGEVRPEARWEAELQAKQWEPRCPQCRGELRARPTPESAVQQCPSVYALNKKTQEELVLLVGRTYRIPSVSLRFFNVFGPRQSLSNPYNGVAAIFISRLKNRQPPIIYEDGNQSRDFVAVKDVVAAIVAALAAPGADGVAINVGSGEPRSIASIARDTARLLGSDREPEFPGSFRRGDIRHCFADRQRARNLLGLTAVTPFADTLAEVIAWSADARADDKLAEAISELKKHHLV